MQAKGSARDAARKLGVRIATVQDHLLDVVRELGYSGLNEAKHAMGFVATHRKDDGSISVHSLRNLLESQGHRCALTGDRLSPDIAELDHKVPLSMGGTNDLANLQWVCKEANRAKGAMDNESFIQLCQKIASRCPPIVGSLQRA